MPSKKSANDGPTRRKHFHVDSAWSEDTRLILHGIFPDEEDGGVPVEVEVTFGSAAQADEALEAIEEVQGSFEGFDSDLEDED
jgi:hypothetical protein